MRGSACRFTPPDAEEIGHSNRLAQLLTEPAISTGIADTNEIELGKKLSGGRLDETPDGDQ
jgi:hypothetical protein